MTRARYGLCLALALVAPCVLATDSSRVKLVRARTGLSVEAVAESALRAGSLYVQGDVTWNGSHASAQLTDVIFASDPLPAMVDAAARMAGDGDPQAVRLQARRADGSAYTWSLAYTLFEQRFRIKVTDGFQLVSAIVELDASDDLPEP